MLPEHVQLAFEAAVNSSSRFAFPAAGNAFSEFVASEFEDIQSEFVTILISIPLADLASVSGLFPDAVAVPLRQQSSKVGQCLLWENGNSELSRQFERLPNLQSSDQPNTGQREEEFAWQSCHVVEAPWENRQLRLIFAVGKGALPSNPVWVEFFDSYVDLILLIGHSGRLGSQIPPISAALGNLYTSVVVVSVDDESTSAGILHPLSGVRVISTTLVAIGNLPAMFRVIASELADPVAQHRSYKALSRLRRALLIEQERLASIIDIRDRATRNSSRSAIVRPDEDAAKQRQKAKELAESLLAQIEPNLGLDDLGLQCEQLVLRINRESLDVRETQSYAARHTPGRQSILKSLFPRDFLVTVRQDALNDISDKIGKACRRQMEHDAMTIARSLNSIEHEVTAHLTDIFPEGYRPRTLELPRLEKSAYGQFGTLLEIEFVHEEKLVRAGIFGHFAAGQSVAMRLFSIAGLLIGGTLGVYALAEGVKVSRAFLQPFMFLVVLIAIGYMIFRVRMSPGEERERTEEIQAKLRERLLTTIEASLRKITGERAQIHRQHLRRLKDALDRYWYQVDDALRACQQTKAAEQATYLRSSAAVLAAFKEKSARIQALAQQILQSLNGVQKAADIAHQKLQSLILSQPTGSRETGLPIHAPSAATPASTSPASMESTMVMAGHEAVCSPRPPRQSHIAFPSRSASKGQNP